MFGIGNDPFGPGNPQGNPQGDQQNQYGDKLVDRIMSAEYNLSVQRGDTPQAANVLARMFGQWLQNRFSR